MDKLNLPFLPLTWQVFGIEITPYILLTPVFVFLYLFLVWIFLAKDYGQQETVGLSVGTILAFLVGGRLTYIFLNFDKFGFDIGSWFIPGSLEEINYLAGIASMFVYVLTACHNSRLSTWYFLERFVFPVSIVAFLINFSLFIGSTRTIFLGRTVVFLVIIVSAKLLSGYRSFVWYGSGKAGFLFFIAVAEYFLLSIILAFLLADFSYWQLVVNVVILLVSLVGVYLLSGKKIKRFS